MIVWTLLEAYVFGTGMVAGAILTQTLVLWQIRLANEKRIEDREQLEFERLMRTQTLMVRQTGGTPGPDDLAAFQAQAKAARDARHSAQAQIRQRALATELATAKDEHRESLRELLEKYSGK